MQGAKVGLIPDPRPVSQFRVPYMIRAHMPDYADDLRATVVRASASLAAMPDEAAARRPAPGKWSPKEIVGHLVDSAANNHQRFVRAQSQDDLVFPATPRTSG